MVKEKDKDRQETLEEGNPSSWSIPCRKKKFNLIKMTEKKSLSMPLGVNF